MQFDVGEKYQIATDRYNWMFRQRRGIDKKTGEQRWDVWGYWGTLEQLVRAIPDHMARRMDGEEMEWYSEYQDDIRKLQQALREQRNVIFKEMGYAG
jgi:hypothetical protein